MNQIWHDASRLVSHNPVQTKQRKRHVTSSSYTHVRQQNNGMLAFPSYDTSIAPVLCRNTKSRQKFLPKWIFWAALSFFPSHKHAHRAYPVFSCDNFLCKRQKEVKNKINPKVGMKMSFSGDKFVLWSGSRVSWVNLRFRPRAWHFQLFSSAFRVRVRGTSNFHQRLGFRLGVPFHSSKLAHTRTKGKFLFFFFFFFFFFSSRRVSSCVR